MTDFEMGTVALLALVTLSIWHFGHTIVRRLEEIIRRLPPRN